MSQTHSGHSISRSTEVTKTNWPTGTHGNWLSGVQDDDLQVKFHRYDTQEKEYQSITNGNDS